MKIGFALGRNGNGIIRVHAKSLQKAKQKLRKLTSRSQGRSVRTVMRNVKVFMQGWLGYYAIADMTDAMKDWNGGLRRRRRMYVWKQWKKPKTHVTNLRKSGPEDWKAYRNRNTRKDCWAVAGSGVLTHTVTNERLAQAGCFDIARKYKSLHC